jgi:asparagine synthase (glutamine-hydrolysing)
MCGFICQFNFGNSFRDDKQVLLNASTALAHRGPDAKKYKNIKNFQAVFYRLSIRDLSANGNQPIFSYSKNLIMVFNGEIYNTKYLLNFLNKSELKGKSDSEILINLFEKKGPSVLKLLKGMFSFVIYDVKKNKIFAARDRFGIKPLYYYKDKNKITFSSEIKPLLRIVNSVSFNDKSFFDLFNKGYLDHDDKTFFKDIVSLMPGNQLTINSSKKLHTKQYWNIAYSNNDIFENNKDEIYHSEKLKFILNQSINDHLISDVDIGLFLSGGSDSSSIANLIKFNSDLRIENFTYSFQNENKFSEVNEARMISKLLNQKHHVEIITPDYIKDNFNNIVNEMESPFTSMRLFAVRKLYERASKEGKKVIIEGHGGDEMFGGYGYNIVPYLIDFYRRFGFEELKKNNFYKYFKNNKFSSFNKFLTLHDQGLSTTDGTCFLNSNIEISNNLNLTKELQPQMHNSYLINSQLLDIKFIKIPRMLKYTDRMSMRFGVEARVPYLDHELFHYCFNLSHNLKFKNGESRYLLKKVSREINSKISFKKNKINIVDPQKSWLKTKLKDFVLDELSSLDFINNDFINFKSTKKLLKAFYEKKNVKSSYLLFKILTSHKFIQNFKK